MIDEKKLIEELSKNSIFEKITNAEGKNVFEIIEEQPKVGGWIPVSERLPEEPDYYEATVDFGSERVTTTIFYSVRESRWGAYESYVTAWRERLPEPYKESKEKTNE